MTCDVIGWSSQRARWRLQETSVLYGRRAGLKDSDGRITWGREMISIDSMINDMLHMEDIDNVLYDGARHDV